MEILFIPVRLVDILDILIVAYILYKLYELLRGTIAVQLFLGLLALYLLNVLVTATDMTMLRMIFNAISQVYVLALIVIFQPEIRRLLLAIGRNPLVRRLVGTPEQMRVIEEVTAAVSEMQKRKIGALIAFARSTGLRAYIETGTIIQARVHRDLLLAIFWDKNPLHDGAVIVQGNRIEAARCILPISHSMRLSPHLGLRHRAAVGLSEQTDAFVVVVSEETGMISVAERGELKTNLSVQELREYMIEALAQPEVTAEEGTPSEAAATAP